MYLTFIFPYLRSAQYSTLDIPGYVQPMVTERTARLTSDKTVTLRSPNCKNRGV